MRFFSTGILRLLLILVISQPVAFAQLTPSDARSKAQHDASTLNAEFRTDVAPLLQKYCVNCHGGEDAESGIRLERLSGEVEDQDLRVWQGIRKQVAEQKMPPEDEPQFSDQQRTTLTEWIDNALHLARSRPVERNGSVRRLTVAQYRNTLRDLLGLTEDLTDILSPDAISKDGFTNNSQVMQLSPLQIEAYFNIAERALDLCIVNEKSKPEIQKFRVDLGQSINPEPFPERLILGANNHLLKNEDFVVTQLTAMKSFAFDPFFMRTKYRFHEGYQGNSTVRGWREYDNISHSVFACMRGTLGYPKGNAYETIPQGLLLRPAIPSAELFQQESTYGPKANFKISLRELPDHGNFRVTVKAATYDDGLLLDKGAMPADEGEANSITVSSPAEQQSAEIPKPGIYQVDVHADRAASDVEPNGSRLTDQLIGAWRFDENANSQTSENALIGKLTAGASFVDSPFGNAVSVDGNTGSVVVPRDDTMNVGEGDFTVAAWIRPHELRQGGIVCLGKYSWTHGWYFDMPDHRGVLRIETATPQNQKNGTVASPPGMITPNKWQHVAAIVKRGENQTRLYVNGYQVAEGTIPAVNLDNPAVDLHIGRIQDSKLFHGEIDEVHLFRRALDLSEIQALVEPGRRFVKAPPPEKPRNLSLQLGNRFFSGVLSQPAFLVARLPAGPMPIQTSSGGAHPLGRVVLTPLSETDDTARRFAAFEKRLPRVGVHLGLRRDCGSTFAPIQTPQNVGGNAQAEYVFEGAINNYPSPDVQEGNDNYLAGVREIGVRSEYTDGRDMPRLLIRSVEFEGPLYETWPPKTHSNIFPDSPNKTGDERYARDVLASFATRAFRRPATDDEVASLLAIWRESFDDSNNFQQSVKDAVIVTLTSPQFLFLIENSESPAPEALSSHELASKLSYFLWNSAPDKKLLTLAANGQLLETVDSQIDRMIEDQRFEQFISEFATQWLSLKKLDVVETDRKRFPRLTRDTKNALREEPQQLLSWLFRSNMEIRHLVQSEFVMANEITASYYSLNEDVESGFRFVPVRHESPNLGGVLTQAGILAALSDGREPNPVKRGAWLARKIIAQPPEDPPPNVPELEDLTHLTLRERLERHRNQKGCVACHTGIDPWGIPFEQYDAGGLIRQDTVDAHSVLPDATEVADANALKRYLATDRIDQVAFSVLKHLLTYATGRTLMYNETEQLRSAALEMKADGYLMRDMIHFVVHSNSFMKK